MEDLAAARDTGVAAIVDAAIKDYVKAHGATPPNAPQTPCEREDGLPHTATPPEPRTRHKRLWTLLRRLWAVVRGDCGRQGGDGSFQKVETDAHRPRCRENIAR